MPRRPGLRTVGIVLILAWTIVPLYWTLNSSLQTDAQITARPSHYVPPTPSLKHYTDLLLGDASKARRVLGWSHKTGFRELVAEMMEADLAGAIP